MTLSGWLAVATLIHGLAWVASDRWWRNDTASGARWATTSLLWGIFLAHAFALPVVVLIGEAS